MDGDFLLPLADAIKDVFSPPIPLSTLKSFFLRKDVSISAAKDSL